MTKNTKFPFGLNSTISASHNAHPDDVMLLKQLLSESGHYEIPDFGITPYSDTPLIESIKSFQKEHGLAVDGVVKPDGETIQTLAARSHRYKCTNCGAIHGGVYSSKLCADCYLK